MFYRRAAKALRTAKILYGSFAIAKKKKRCVSGNHYKRQYSTLQLFNPSTFLKQSKLSQAHTGTDNKGAVIGGELSGKGSFIKEVVQGQKIE